VVPARSLFDFFYKNPVPTNSEFVRTGYRPRETRGLLLALPARMVDALPIFALFLMTIPLICTNAPISHPFDYVASSHQSPVNSVGVNLMLCIRLRGGWRESRFGGSRPLSVGKKTSLTMFPGGDRSRDPLRREVS
jgi:hypothetical protein